MPRLDQFKYHLFLSYGWADIPNEGEGDRGWVKEFKRQLQLQLNGELGHDAKIFLDAEKKPNELEADLESAIQSSALFLSVLSPASCRQNSWCRWEIDQFTQHSAGILPGLGQVLGVLAREVEKDDWPAPLPQIVPWDFMVDGFPAPEADLRNTANPYKGHLIQKLAREIKQKIIAIEGQISRTVFLAHTSPNFQQQIARLSKEVNLRGNFVIRGRYETGEAQPELMKRAARDLRRSGLALHILDPAGDMVPERWSDSIEGLQIRAAVERFGAVKNRMIIWPEPSRNVGLAAEAKDLAQILADPGLENLDSVLRDNMPKQAASAAVKTLPDTPVRPPDPPVAVAATAETLPPLFMFVECVPEDLKRVESLRPGLGIRIRPPIFEGDEEDRKQLLDDFLEMCHGVGVYFGKRNELQALRACQALRKELRARGREVPRCVILEPDDDDRLNTVFPGYDNYGTGKLIDFAKRVREQRS